MVNHKQRAEEKEEEEKEEKKITVSSPTQAKLGRGEKCRQHVKGLCRFNSRSCWWSHEEIQVNQPKPSMNCVQFGQTIQSSLASSKQALQEDSENLAPPPSTQMSDIFKVISQMQSQMSRVSEVMLTLGHRV